VALLAAVAAVALWRAGAGSTDLARTTARERLRLLRGWGGRRVVPVAAVGLVAALLASTADPGAPGLVATAVGWGATAWPCIPAQQHRLAGLAAGPAPVVLALNGTAVHLGFAAGALLGGLALGAPSGGTGALRLVVAACCGAGLFLHLLLIRRDRS
jgi:predicted MFS family arabinose efflux permease